MIYLTLKELDNSYCIKATGHSGNKNQSIVCASVSVLLETWRLTESKLENILITHESGLIEASIPKTPISNILFIQLSIGLTAIQQQYPKEISLNIGG